MPKVRDLLGLTAPAPEKPAQSPAAAPTPTRVKIRDLIEMSGPERSPAGAGFAAAPASATGVQDPLQGPAGRRRRPLERYRVEESTPLMFLPHLAANFAKQVVEQPVMLSEFAGLLYREVGVPTAERIVKIAQLASPETQAQAAADLALEPGRALETMRRVGEGAIGAGKKALGALEKPGDLPGAVGEHLFENPLDAVTLSLLGGAAAVKGGLTALKALPRSPTMAGMITRGRQIAELERIEERGIFNVARDATKRALAKSNPEVARVIEIGEQKGRAARMIGQERSKVAGRLTRLGEELRREFKLEPAELEKFSDYVMGLDPVPPTSTPQLQGAMKWWADLSAQDRSDLVRYGKLTAPAAESRPFQPLRVERIGEAREAELQAARGKGGKLGSRAESQIKAINDQIAADLRTKGRDLPIYFPFLRDPSSMGGSGLASEAVRRYRPSFLRQSFGRLFSSDQYLKDPRVVIARHERAVQNYLQNERVVERLQAGTEAGPNAFGVRRIADVAELRPDEVLFAPDGAMRMWRRSVDLTKVVGDAAQSIGNVDVGFHRALQAMTDLDAMELLVSGFTKGQKYAIPRAVAGRVKAEFKPAPEWVRLLYDKPLDYWRDVVLALRPAWINNNVIGNMIFTTLQGVAPRHYALAKVEQFIARTPDEIRTGGLFMGETRLTNVSDLANAADPRLRRVAKVYEWLENTPPGSWVGTVADRSKAFNSGVEEYWRRVSYAKAADKIARKSYLKRTGDRFYRAFDQMQEMDRFTPVQVQKAIDEVNFFLNDYLNVLRPWERAFFRRIVGFPAFLKFQMKLALSLPVQYPGRSAMLHGLAIAGEDAQRDAEPLPSYMTSNGLVDLDQEFTVNGRKLHAFMSTTGSNPLILGSGPTALGEGRPSDIIGALAQMGTPPVAILRTALTHKDVFGRTFTDPSVVQAGDKFFRIERDPKTGRHRFARDPAGKKIETPAPQPNVGEQALQAMPISGFVRSMIQPRANWTAEPLSVVPSKDTGPGARSVTERTRLTEFLKYFSSFNIVLVDTETARKGELRGAIIGPRQRSEQRRALVRRRKILEGAEGRKVNP